MQRETGENQTSTITLSWDEARILARAMVVTLGGEIAYTEYETRVGASPALVADMIFAIEKADLIRRLGKDPWAKRGN